MLTEGDHGTNSLYPYPSSLFILLLLLLISYGYCYFIVKKLPKGMPRLIALLGVFYTFFLVPWYFPSSIFLRGLLSFFISWISSFKLLLFSFDKGDLILCDNYLHFVAVAGFPLKTKSKSSPSQPPLQTLLQVLALSSIPLFLGLPFRDAMLIFLALLIFVGCLGTIIRPYLEVIPILDQPHRATSLQVFWGKRWNRVSSDILRHTIYNPTQKVLKPYVGVGLGKVVALVVTLVMSGVMHEVMFYHMTCGMRPTWEVTRFFVLQGLCMALEIGVKRCWVRTLGWSPLHPLISAFLTLGFVLATSYWLLVLPVWRIAGMGCDMKGLGLFLLGA